MGGWVDGSFYLVVAIQRVFLEDALLHQVQVDSARHGRLVQRVLAIAVREAPVLPVFAVEGEEGRGVLVVGVAAGRGGREEEEEEEEKARGDEEHRAAAAAVSSYHPFSSSGGAGGGSPAQCQEGRNAPCPVLRVWLWGYGCRGWVGEGQGETQVPRGTQRGVVRGQGVRERGLGVAQRPWGGWHICAVAAEAKREEAQRASPGGKEGVPSSRRQAQ